ncbi:AP-3 complex subunit mu-1 isoform X1 [Oncorhynchus kisutch]|uniref:AP-3 complex subunit mu-1 n=1 Tax=Oncorhynchus kisutch TaxID=8019 RepID=A0A8C7IIK3_ONCKI|nr:AP-3 complex subunit mu-1 isoform X1 [Oncorhynchus kisutch]
MINSLFLINPSGEIFLEKHWKSVVSRSVCDYFLEAKEKALEPEDVPPVIHTPHHYLISIYRDKLFFLSVIQTEVPPLFVIEFLHRVAEMIQDYFGECSETVVKDHMVMVYELLEEMLDNGFPLATESNVLKEMIRPPTILRSVVNTLTGTSNVGDTLLTGQLSTIPWRRAGVRYTNNEAYFDVVEEIDAILDQSGRSSTDLSTGTTVQRSWKSDPEVKGQASGVCVCVCVVCKLCYDWLTGTTVFAEIQGVVEACVKLSGMPDLTLSFMNPRLLDDVSFHPCVRYKLWESERVLSFIPPDGNFTLMTYHVNAQNLVAIPVYVKQSISFFECGSDGRLDVTVGPKQTMGKTVEGVMVTVHLPKTILSINLTATQGSYTYDNGTKLLVWDIGKLNPQKLPNLRGSLSLQAGAPKPEENPSLNIDLKIQQLAISGLKVNRLDMFGEKYKPFKGVKYITKAGKFQVRT